ncbi:iron ABC transporter permease [Campylobacter sp. MIT 99-7217]|uniref:FecCD family ABC transporter permease n=1 Tax=Campylobacter sp. MIT 99-7217 TaxID=535091 RepID=UPI00115A1869|nr:iron ABC transporter permease [Campylobacter sp. MIT 99-7217]TQR30971.1 iron ABC transporter permease [Campylobacter sp. MIT 99-7217]
MNLDQNSEINKALKAHRKREFRRFIIIIAFLVVAFISLIFDIATGPSMLAPREVLDALLIPFGKIGVEATTEVIVWDLRLPIALMALVVGATLGVGGAEIQTLLNNPMASPYTLGLAAAAGFGASLVIAFGSAGIPLLYAVPVGAFVMTMLSASVLFGFAALRHFSSATLVLVGIALLFLFQSLLSLVQFLSSPEISQLILFWLFGSLQKANWTNLLFIFIVSSLCIVLLLKDSWKLTALRLGEARAKSMGVNLNFLRFKTLLIVSVMTATAISFVGVIGFIGLVAPHIARMLVGEDQRFFLPSAMFCGAAFLSVASVLSKVIIPGALFPVGIVTSFVGVPFFFWIILSRKKVC